MHTLIRGPRHRKCSVERIHAYIYTPQLKYGMHVPHGNTTQLKITSCIDSLIKFGIHQLRLNEKVGDLEVYQLPMAL